MGQHIFSGIMYVVATVVMLALFGLWLAIAALPMEYLPAPWGTIWMAVWMIFSFGFFWSACHDDR